MNKVWDKAWDVVLTTVITGVVTWLVKLLTEHFRRHPMDWTTLITMVIILTIVNLIMVEWKVRRGVGEFALWMLKFLQNQAGTEVRTYNIHQGSSLYKTLKRLHDKGKLEGDGFETFWLPGHGPNLSRNI